MIDPVTRHNLLFGALYLGLCLAIIAWQLLPIGFHDGAVPAPDLLLAITLAWLLRQPSVVPVWAVIAVFLLADFLFERPPGLWTVFVLMATEWLRRRRVQIAEMPFLLEWAAFGGAVIALVIGYRVALWVLVVPQASLGLTLTHAIVTIAVYPLVVGISKYILGLRKLGPTESDSVIVP